MPEPITAKSISVSCCSHGTVYIHLYDANEKVVAVAAMDVEAAADLLEDFGETCEQALKIVLGVKPGDTLPEVH
jgi:hypothetical protein